MVTLWVAPKRMEKLVLRSYNTQAKIIGTIVSISGAFVVVLYKGPPVVLTTSPSSQLNWVFGGLLLAADYLLISVWYILQTQIIKAYPAELQVVLFFRHHYV